HRRRRLYRQPDGSRIARRRRARRGARSPFGWIPLGRSRKRALCRRRLWRPGASHTVVPRARCGGDHPLCRIHRGAGFGARPLRYYRNNTVNSRALIESAIECGIRHFIFSSTAAVYGNPAAIPVDEDASTRPISPYGWSKLMTEFMLRDASRAHGLNHVILRYFNVAGADPQGRTGQSSATATHLIKVAAETALRLRPKLEIFGTDYPTPDGTCIRDYIHVSDLAAAHALALRYLREGG